MNWIEWSEDWKKRETITIALRLSLIILREPHKFIDSDVRLEAITEIKSALGITE